MKKNPAKFVAMKRMTSAKTFVTSKVFYNFKSNLKLQIIDTRWCYKGTSMHGLFLLCYIR